MLVPRVKKNEQETYSEKLSIAFKPETKRRLQVLSQIDGRSFNATVNFLAENYCERRIAEIKQYDDFIEKMRNAKNGTQDD